MNTHYFLMGLFVFVSAVLLFSSYFVNEFNSEGVIFGVRVPTKYREDEKIKKVMVNYRRNNTVLVLIVLALFLVVFTFFKNIGVFTLGILLVAFSNGFSYAVANKEMKKVKSELNWASIVASNKVFVEIGGKKEKEGKGYIFMFMIAIFISLVAFIIAVVRFDDLPNLVPVHFSNGVVDRYADITTTAGKFEYYMLAFLGLGLNILMFVSTIFYMKKMNTGRLNGGSLFLIKGRRNLSKNVMGNLMGITSLMITAMISLGVMLTTGVINYDMNVEKIMMYPTILIIAGPLLYVVYAQRKENKRLLTEDKGGEEYYVDDDDNYLFGIFYYNKKDPSVIVIRRMGMGYDFNYATITGKIFAVVMSLILIGTIIITFFVNVLM